MSRQNSSSSGRFKRGIVLVILLPLILPLALSSIALFLLYTAALYLLVWLVWLPRGKDVLLVYSDSPIWHEYMTTQILPLLRERAVVLNWSERRKWQWWSLAAAAFHHFGGGRDFNPLVVLFRPFHLARVFRFWSPFKDWKSGHTEPLESLRKELATAL
jgi:hypothetical protein